MDKACEKCKAACVAHRVEHRVRRLPPLLVLHLKRFRHEALEDGQHRSARGAVQERERCGTGFEGPRYRSDRAAVQDGEGEVCGTGQEGVRCSTMLVLAAALRKNQEILARM